MKNIFTYTQPRLISLSWYIWLSVVSFASLGNRCTCQINHPTDNIYTDNTLPKLSLKLEKLSYNRGNKQLIVIIKNTGTETAKDLSLRCTNISQDERSRSVVHFNNTLTTTTIPVPDLATGSSTQEIHIPINFKTAKKVLVQMEVISGQHIVVTDSIPVNLYPIDLLPIGDTIIIVKSGDTKELKLKLIVDPHEQPIDFTKFQLAFMQSKATDMIVLLEGMGTILDQSINYKTLTGPDLEKLAKQQEILIKVKNNTNNRINEVINSGISFMLSDNGNHGEEITQILYGLAPKIKNILLPATTMGNVDFVKQAIADGANVNAENINHTPVLHLATQGGYPEIVKILLQHGANVNAIDNKDGNTALHVAASKGNREIVSLLLRYSANKNIKNDKRQTAAGVAQDKQIRDLMNNWKK